MSVLSFPSPFLNMTNSFWQGWVTSHLPGPNPSPLTKFPVVPQPVQPASVSPSWYHHTKRCWRISLSWYFQKSSLSRGMMVIQCSLFLAIHRLLWPWTGTLPLIVPLHNFQYGHNPTLSGKHLWDGSTWEVFCLEIVLWKGLVPYWYLGFF